MKKIYTILILFCVGITVFGQDMWKEANEAYSKENYKKAIDLYQDVLKNQGKSIDLYYNLGNAYYKDGKYPEAILNYERGLLLAPGNSDLRFNLEMAKTRIVDKVEPVGTFFITLWIHDLRDSMSANGWAITGIISFILVIVSLYLYFFTRQVVLKKIGFFVGLGLLVLSVVSNLFASDLNKKINERSAAIVFAPTITVKSSPAESGTDLFVLHEGTKISVLSKLGNWSEILLEDGNRGWLPSSDIEVI